ncbi:hypothetical protein SteCoe_29861 [Stentor coeruleus]|uniref:IQ calmodulin-binding motif family protein n=1 Tax=Stentor coeruleus TaxID=5963 RepID=A0A1R2B502_9CILI|nr:hypothetical protein SteCoe_29861 [Stentor coeruleus]
MFIKSGFRSTRALLNPNLAHSKASLSSTGKSLNLTANCSRIFRNASSTRSKCLNNSFNTSQRLQKSLVAIRAKKIETQSIRNYLIEKKHRKLIIKQNFQAVNRKFKDAAIKIQKNFRGYLVRKRYKTEIQSYTKGVLAQNLSIMRNRVKEIWDNLFNMTDSAVLIQKCVRRFIQLKRYRKYIKLNKIFTKRYKNICKQTFEIFSEYIQESKNYDAKLIIESKLEGIKQRLDFIRIKEYWNKCKYNWKVIQKHYGLIIAEDPLEVPTHIVIITPEGEHDKDVLIVRNKQNSKIKRMKSRKKIKIPTIKSSACTPCSRSSCKNDSVNLFDESIEITNSKSKNDLSKHNKFNNEALVIPNEFAKNTKGNLKSSRETLKSHNDSDKKDKDETTKNIDTNKIKKSSRKFLKDTVESFTGKEQKVTKTPKKSFKSLEKSLRDIDKNFLPINNERKSKENGRLFTVSTEKKIKDINSDQISSKQNEKMEEVSVAQFSQEKEMLSKSLGKSTENYSSENFLAKSKGVEAHFQKITKKNSNDDEIKNLNPRQSLIKSLKNISKTIHTPENPQKEIKKKNDNVKNIRKESLITSVNNKSSENNLTKFTVDLPIERIKVMLGDVKINEEDKQTLLEELREFCNN